eukprot:TRINITY_DN45573_c0_g1_i1.p1 TRINITY_DN45573_c0_g1~~TRINITY_DN45573_c0_g1_i1.p1  ORF type:complete len:362 (-),score=48.84 TRINITY_DN45573_c0_g1_i1:12-1097(-)
MSKQIWEVIGGSSTGGIIVRQGVSLKSPESSDGRLATGSLVEELNLQGERLQFRKITGSGPGDGWVSRTLHGKDLVIRANETPSHSTLDDEMESSAMGSLKSFPTEQALLDSGFQVPFAVVEANRRLVEKGITPAVQTQLINFIDSSSGNLGTAGYVADKINSQGRTSLGIVSFSQSWTDEALRFLRRQKFSDPAVKLAALNYANCNFPGGDYSAGGYVRAQEEELCRQFPALFDSLKSCPEASCSEDAYMCEYQNHVLGARFEDGYSHARNVLFTPEVQCMRGGSAMSYKLLQRQQNRVSSAFVSAAAPLFKRGNDLAFKDWISEPEEWYEKVFLNVFWAPKSVDENYDVIVADIGRADV